MLMIVDLLCLYIKFIHVGVTFFIEEKGVFVC
uniref:Uncharacterized protein n=1 Tax=Lepeophtheirus salmonis TaxID=72036 RepID=A0A0K2V4P1_LEPSM